MDIEDLDEEKILEVVDLSNIWFERHDEKFVPSFGLARTSLGRLLG